jgi:hypothetical protein
MYQSIISFSTVNGNLGKRLKSLIKFQSELDCRPVMSSASRSTVCFKINSLRRKHNLRTGLIQTLLIIQPTGKSGGGQQNHSRHIANHLSPDCRHAAPLCMPESICRCRARGLGQLISTEARVLSVLM